MASARKVLQEILVGFVIILLPVSARGGDEVTLCHRPPGNPENAATITVGAAAAATHLSHGDTLGACPGRCRDNGAVCAGNNECCSENCSDGVCAAPCTADGGRCSSASECCGGLCSDQGFCSSQCTAGGPELGQPECTFSAPCCAGYGNCIQGFCWTEQQCSLLGEACDDVAGVVCCFDDVCFDGSCVPSLQ